MENAMDLLIRESRAKPAVPGPVSTDVMYRRTGFRRHCLDVYQPFGASGQEDPSPVVFFLHGGSWIHGDKITIRVVDRFLHRMREAGYAVLAVNYTTSFLRGLRGPVDNVRAALSWVADNAQEYNLDPSRVGFYGVSAGGHLALVIASTGSPIDPAFVFAECAPSDLEALRDGEAFENSAKLRFFGRRALREFSPIRLMSDRLPPVLLFHGGNDTVVHVNQSVRYAEALRSAGVPVEFFLYPDGDHAFLNLADEVWFNQETEALRYFAERF